MSYRKIFKDEINYLLFLLTASAEAQISVAIELPLIVQVMLLGIILSLFIISLTRVTIKSGNNPQPRGRAPGDPGNARLFFGGRTGRF